jgi:hypothetical protein
VAKQGMDKPKSVPDEDSIERSREAVERIVSDVEFVIENFEFALEPGKALESYLQSRNLLAGLLTLDLIYEAILLVYIVKNYSFVLTQIAEIYRLFSLSSIDSVVTLAYSVDFIIGSITFMTGFYALWSHKTLAYEWFIKLVLITVVTKLMMSYLNVLNLLVFIMKMVLFLFSRFVLSVLHTVLIVP